MGKTHRTAVVIIPPEGEWEPIQAIRREHDRQFSRWMPHITMLYPFRPRNQFGVVTHEFVKVCGRFKPFEVELAEFSYFSHSQNNHTIWLAPRPSELLIDLQTALWRAVPECDEVRRFGNGFTPHLSVGQVHGRKPIELLADFKKGWTPIRFRVSEVSLIWRDDPPNEFFRIGRRVPLGWGG